MNLTAFQEAVRRRAGLPSTDALLAAADLTEIVNESLHAISTERRWPWLESTRTFVTVAGTGSYATATRWVETRMLKIDTFAPQRAGSRAELEAAYPSASTRGTPRVFTVSGDLLVLRPIPDAVYTVTEVFYQFEPDLVSGSDNPLMPTWCHGSIVWWATAEAHRRLRNDERAERAQARADDWLRRMHDNVRRSTPTTRPTIRAGSFI